MLAVLICPRHLIMDARDKPGHDAVFVARGIM